MREPRYGCSSPPPFRLVVTNMRLAASFTVMKTGWTFAVLLVLAPEVSGYSVLTHEAIVDSLWLDGITPLIKKRFPDVTEEQLLKAHAYSYGGTVIQDMGYFPLGSKL